MATRSSIDCRDRDEAKLLRMVQRGIEVYGTHVLAEEIIETDLSREDIIKIVKQSPNGKNINVFELYFKEDGSAEMIEWDDYTLDGKAIEGETKEGMNYYLLNESTPYGTVFCLWED